VNIAEAAHAVAVRAVVRQIAAVSIK
jgi:hypothetical protein